MSMNTQKSHPRKLKINVSQQALDEFCQRHAMRKLAFFGSVLGEDFGPESDIDVLVDFESGHAPGLAFFAMQEELSAILGRRVDLHTPNFLSSYFRRDVEATADVRYLQV